MVIKLPKQVALKQSEATLTGTPAGTQARGSAGVAGGQEQRPPHHGGLQWENKYSPFRDDASINLASHLPSLHMNVYITRLSGEGGMAGERRTRIGLG